jgi:hypothetical protein
MSPVFLSWASPQALVGPYLSVFHITTNTAKEEEIVGQGRANDDAVWRLRVFEERGSIACMHTHQKYRWLPVGIRENRSYRSGSVAKRSVFRGFDRPNRP